jgi:probable HAF family extracellular repeat protein
MTGRNAGLIPIIAFAAGLLGCGETTSPVDPPSASTNRVTTQACSILTCYVARDLGTLAGGTQSGAAAINDSGVVVGNSNTASGQVLAFRYRSGQMTALPLLPHATAAAATDINTAGQVVGSSSGRGWFLPTSGGPIEILPRSGGSVYPAAVNNKGVVVGSYLPGPPATGWHAFKWTQRGGFVDIHSSLYLESGARDINDAGTVVGYVKVDPDNTHAALWAVFPPLVADLGTLGGLSSAASAIDSIGTVVGWSANARGGTEAFRRTTAGMASLGAGNASTATGISNQGRIVGTWYPTTSGSQGLTVLGSALTGLPSPTGAVSATGAGVNRCGVMVGQAYLGGQTLHAVMWYRLANGCQP